jgi:hypothetical protein
MPLRAHKTEGGGNQMPPPAGVILKPPVTMEELKTDTECDPEGAEEFVALIRALRKEGYRPVAL